MYETSQAYTPECGCIRLIPPDLLIVEPHAKRQQYETINKPGIL